MESLSDTELSDPEFDLDELDVDPGPCMVDRVPTEILELIFDYCPGTPINRVCRRWRALIMQKGWIKYHVENFAASPKAIRWYERESGEHMSDACYYAARFGSLTTLQWAYMSGHSLDTRVCDAAAARGDLSILKWAHQLNGFRIITEHALAEAVARRDYKMVEWIRSANRHIVPGVVTFSKLAAMGNIEAAEWMCLVYDIQGVSWDEVRKSAVTAGHWGFVKWMLYRRLIGITPALIKVAARLGQVDYVLQNLYVYDPATLGPGDSRDELMMAAIGGGSIRMVESLLERGFPGAIMRVALVPAVRGDLPMLKFVLEHGNQPCDDTFYGAVKSGNVEMVTWLATTYSDEWLRWVTRHGDEGVINAVIVGNIPMIKLLVGCGATLTYDACLVATDERKFNVLKWLRGGCVKDGTCPEMVPWSEDVGMELAFVGGDIFRWAIANDCPLPAGPCCVLLASYGDLEGVELIRIKYDIVWDEGAHTEHFIEVFTRRGELAIRWALENGYIMSLYVFAALYLGMEETPSWGYIRDVLTPMFFPKIKSRSLIAEFCRVVIDRGDAVSDEDE